MKNVSIFFIFNIFILFSTFLLFYIIYKSLSFCYVFQKSDECEERGQVNLGQSLASCGNAATFCIKLNYNTANDNLNYCF